MTVLIADYDEESYVQALELLEGAERQKMADRLRSAAASFDRLADQLDPPTQEGEADFDGLPLNCFVKVADEWPLLIRKVTKTAADGSQTRSLVTLLDGNVSTYPTNEGESFQFGSCF